MPKFQLLLDVNHNVDDVNTMIETRHVIGEQDAAISSLLCDNDHHAQVDFTDERLNLCIKVIKVVQQLENIRHMTACC